MTAHRIDPELSKATDLTEPASAPQTNHKHAALGLFERYALVLLLVAITVFFSVYRPTAEVFLTSANLKNIAANESVLAVVAVAALIPIVSFRFDLSVGAIVGLSAISSAALMTDQGLPTWLAVGCGIALGALVGVINGVVIAYFEANSLVITLGMATILGGLGTLWTGSTTLLNPSASLAKAANAFTFGIPRIALLMVVVALLIAYLLGKTVYGRHLRSVGSNEDAAHLVGMPVKRVVMLSFTISGALAGLAGVMLLGRTGSATAGIGDAYTLPALAAVFLGSTTVRPGTFTVLGTFVGVFFVAISVNGLTLAGAQDWVEPVFNGAAVVIAVAVAAFLAQRRRGARGR
ncbi:ABC transporter permease [Actinomadura madurae]|uniref:ABC transporter permease n=1 Tax=Actinomadura madurae TaxID=1993 RepID=UPI000D828FE3|nr:ABC transporter permease [Actinomadura madurae]SPT51265.1 D-allose transport system permease protein AlsC [Actinomadura madurae]